jgi:hypothetical protein
MEYDNLGTTNAHFTISIATLLFDTFYTLGRCLTTWATPPVPLYTLKHGTVIKMFNHPISTVMNYWKLLNKGNLQDDIGMKVKGYMFVDLCLIPGWRFDS